MMLLLVDNIVVVCHRPAVKDAPESRDLWQLSVACRQHTLEISSLVGLLGRPSQSRHARYSVVNCAVKISPKAALALASEYTNEYS